MNYPQTKDLWALDVEKSSCIGHGNISHLSWVFTYPHVAMLRHLKGVVYYGNDDVEVECDLTHKIFQCRSGETGPVIPVTVRYTRYSSNDTLAVQLIKAEKPWSVHATITVNLDGNPFGMGSRQDGRFAYVDTNNCPWAERFLEENKIARCTGIIAPSGFCIYPLYEFNPNAIYEYEESEIRR